MEFFLVTLIPCWAGDTNNITKFGADATWKIFYWAIQSDLYALTNKTAQMETRDIKQRGSDQFWQLLSVDTIPIKCNRANTNATNTLFWLRHKISFSLLTKNPISISRKIFSSVKPNSRGGGSRMRKDYQFSCKVTSHQTPLTRPHKVQRWG